MDISIREQLEKREHDILSPDAVQELAADLREKGLLLPAESSQNS